MSTALPCLVRITFGIGGIPPTPDQYGLLVEWRQRQDKRGHVLWYGLVIYAELDVGGQWEVSMCWKPDYYLRPVETTA